MCTRDAYSLKDSSSGKIYGGLARVLLRVGGMEMDKTNGCLLKENLSRGHGDLTALIPCEKTVMSSCKIPKR